MTLHLVSDYESQMDKGCTEQWGWINLSSQWSSLTVRIFSSGMGSILGYLRS